MTDQTDSGKQQHPHDEHEGTVSVYILENIIEAEMLEDLLLANGLPCMIQRFHSESSLGKISSKSGWGQLRVFQRDEQQARNILNNWQNATRQPYEF